MLPKLKSPIQGLFLHSQVARRVFLLFLLSALLPALLLAVLAYSHMRSLDQAHVERQLALEGGHYASGLYERLQAAHVMLKVQAAGLRHGVPVLQSDAELTREVFQRIDTALPTPELGLAHPLLGEPLARGHLARGESVLLTQPVAHAQATRLWLATAVEPARPAAGLLLAELTPAYVWGDPQDLAFQTEACVLDTAGRRLYCSDPARLAQALPAPGGEPVAGLAGAWPHHRRSLFLRAGFAQDDWSIVTLRPPGASDAGWSQLAYVFFGIVVLTLLLVALLSGVQLRRTLVPLERLIEGTRRIAREQFNQPVAVDGHNEFAQLAQALNRMAARLGRQMGTLRALAEIDQEILARADVERVINRVQARLHTLWPRP